MILIINLCKEKLHYYEFVKPLEDIIIKNNLQFITKKYDNITEKDLKKSKRVIICGTSLKDNEYLENLKKFSWIKNFEKPILGICAGFQIIGLLNGSELRVKKEIGYFKEIFDVEFLKVFGETRVYHLHKNYIYKFNKDWISCCNGEGIVQAVKHKEKEIYGVLFHPEVRNKEMILSFLEE